jgi:sugar phosphate isomerase/epimerase
MVELCLAKSLWGVNEAGDPEKWDAMLRRIKEDGYLAVESILVFDVNQNPPLFRELLDKHGLGIFIQLHTASDWSTYNYCTSCELSVHVASFRALVQDCLQHKPLLINVHSGHDSWDLATAVLYFEQVLAIERELLIGEHQDVVLVHETHRQRLLHSPYQTRDILAHPSINGKLRVNCDLSHWVCVCERLFGSDDASVTGRGRDAWWPALLKDVARHCHLVHARIGHVEGPQVVDPRSSTAASELAAHLSWWRVIFAEQLGAATDRRTSIYVTTEHGPEPYQIFDVPGGEVVTAAGGRSALSAEEKCAFLWDVNSFVKAKVQQLYNSLAVGPLKEAGARI